MARPHLPVADHDSVFAAYRAADADVLGFVIGRVHHRESGPEGYVSFLRVVPGHRGIGLGGALLSHQLAQFATRGLPRATLDVDIDNVTTALDLYRSAGMVPVPNCTIWAASMPGALSAAGEQNAAARL